jgi:DWNN domain
VLICFNIDSSIDLVDQIMVCLTLSLTVTVYGDDDEVVPKNSSVVVKRVPAKSSASSLMARINGMAAGPHAGSHGGNSNPRVATLAATES